MEQQSIVTFAWIDIRMFSLTHPQNNQIILTLQTDMFWFLVCFSEKQVIAASIKKRNEDTVVALITAPNTLTCLLATITKYEYLIFKGN